MQHTSCLSVPAGEENPEPWKTLKTHIRPEAKREEQGKVTQGGRYYIRDEQETKSAYFCSLIRGHQSMENRLRWHLDVIFKEDACRAGAGYASQNLSVPRKMASHTVFTASGRGFIKLYWIQAV
jgi:predicted transposase YbfD/YdcC